MGQATANGDIAMLRDLAKQYRDVSDKPIQEERRHLWRKKNSLKPVRPLIYTRAFAWNELPQSECRCEDPFYRKHENSLRKMLYWDSLDDDSIFEPWITVRATHRCTGWGVSGERTHADVPRGSWKMDYPLRSPEDLSKLRAPWHEVDEEDTRLATERLQDAIGDIITVNVDRSPAYWVFSGELSTDLGYLRGIENFMLDMMDNPDWLHRLMAFMRDGVLRTHRQAEEAGDWGLSSGCNQAMAYSEELQDPTPNANGVKRPELWCFHAAQEMELVSPRMHDAFMLQYQIPIMAEFGLSAYGCCENLTQKIDMLRQIPNLRRIAVSPMADAARCAEQIGTDYVLSYRPSPTDMVGYGFDPDRIRSILRRDMEACRDCHFDITLKDVETVQNDPDRVREWVRITREEIERL
jgi:hypothetical protein